MSSERYMKFFEEADTDGDGYLTLEELTAILRKKGYKTSDSEILTMFNAVDTSGDNKISMEEYLVAMGLRPLTEHRFTGMAAVRYPEFDSGFFSKYTTLDHYLNKGAFGTVYGPIPWKDKQIAIKQVMLAQGKVTNDFKKGMEEKQQIWTSLEHKNIMRIHSVDLTRLPKAMFIVMEYAAGGSVTETLRSLGHGNKLPIYVVTDWAKQIADGMMYLHARNIVHRDLKSSNILLMEPYNACNTDTMVTLKIADFDDIKEHDHTMTMSFVGTYAYMAPEFLTKLRFSKASDIWSFGVVIWEMLSGNIPYKGLDSAAIVFKVSRGELNELTIEQSFPEDYKLLLNRCWKSTIRERLSIHDILSALQRIEAGKYKSSPVLIEAIRPKDAEKEGTMIKGLPEKYKSDPVLIDTFRTKVGGENKLINGLTILDKELFVMSAQSSQTVEVYDSIKIGLSRRFNLKEFHNPLDIASCSINKCLYISDYKGDGKSHEILRVDPNGKLIKRWSAGDDNFHKDLCSLSVTYESNVILTLQWQNKLNEYSPDGELIREINLSDADIRYAWHAIKLTNGHFVVSHFNRDDDLHRVCIVDADGKLMKSFGGKRGSSIGQMNCPVYLSVDGDGFVLIADQGNNRVLVLDSNLEFKIEIPSKGKHVLHNPPRIFLDESTNRVFVAQLDFFGTIKVFKL